MCKVTFHHFPACGHIANWTMLSCAPYTHYIRSMPGEFIKCEDADTSHNLISEEDEGSCMWCKATSVIEGSSADEALSSSKIHYPIEGLDAEIPPFEMAAQANPEIKKQTSDGNASDGRSPGHSTMSDICSEISSGDPEGAIHGRDTPERNKMEQLANMIPRCGEEEPLLVEADFSGISSPSSGGAEHQTDAELEEVGYFRAPREILVMSTEFLRRDFYTRIHKYAGR